MDNGEYVKKITLVVKQGDKGSSGDGTSSVFGDEDIASESSSSLIRSLVGAVTDVTDFFFPPDVVGGVCPRVVGHEESIVWNAAAESCDSERVHVVWQAVDNLIWYLAVRSSDLASNPSSWCPLASLLTVVKDKSKLPVCYTYYGEEFAILMVITMEELHIFRGTAAVIKAKAERLAREHGGEAGIVTVDPFHIGQMKPIPWYSASLFEDRARRILASISIFASLTILGISFIVWLMASMAAMSAQRDLDAAKERTQQKVLVLLRNAEEMRSSPLREQIKDFLNVNDGLLSMNGLLTVYEIKGKNVRWRAVIPPSTTADRISALGGKTIETTEKGVAIGNDAEIKYEETKGLR